MMAVQIVSQTVYSVWTGLDVDAGPLSALRISPGAPEKGDVT